MCSSVRTQGVCLLEVEAVLGVLHGWGLSKSVICFRYLGCFLYLCVGHVKLFLCVRDREVLLVSLYGAQAKKVRRTGNGATSFNRISEGFDVFDSFRLFAGVLFKLFAQYEDVLGSIDLVENADFRGARVGFCHS